MASRVYSWFGVFALSAVAFVLVSTPGHADARPATSRHMGWEVDRVTSAPYKAATLAISVAPTADDAARVSVVAHTGGRRYTAPPGATLQVPLGAQGGRVRIEVVDHDGGEPYREVINVPRGAHTTMTVQSSWSHPGHPGVFVNGTSQCRRARTLRFEVRVPGDLSVGRPIEVAPGASVAGPRLPDGDYTIWVQRPAAAEDWPVAASRKLTVEGGAYHFDPGCVRDRYARR